jgi:hypothetical protein
MNEIHTLQDAYETIRAHFTKPDAVIANVNLLPIADPEEGDTMIGSGGNGCVYRYRGIPESPIRCAAGVLVPDDEYSPEAEGQNYDVLSEYSPTFAAMLSIFNMKSFVEDAQSRHDGSDSPAMFVRGLDTLAVDQYGLELVS